MSSLVRHRDPPLACKFDFNLSVRVRRAPDGDLHAPLQDGMITEYCSDREGSLPTAVEGEDNREAEEQDEGSRKTGGQHATTMRRLTPQRQWQITVTV
jgi:hypothetical protein